MFVHIEFLMTKIYFRYYTPQHPKLEKNFGKACYLNYKWDKLNYILQLLLYFNNNNNVMNLTLTFNYDQQVKKGTYC